MKNNFSRSNVNESTLQVTDPMRSSFDLSHRNNLTLKLGRLTPVNLERLIGTDVIQGSLNPQFQLEVAGTPTIGKIRLDTHTFQVNMRRIHSLYRQFVEDTTNNSVIPAIDIPTTISFYIRLMNASSSDGVVSNKLDILFDSQNQVSSTDSQQQIAAKILRTFRSSLYSRTIQTANELGFMRDFLSIEYSRLGSLLTTIPNDDSAIAFVLYEITRPLFGEGSLLDFIGYPIYRKDTAWYKALSDSRITSIFKSTLTNYALIDLFCLYGWSSTNTMLLLSQDLYSEMPLRACYAVYYDYFRDWHVEPRSKVLDPDTFSATNLLTQASISTLATARLNTLSNYLQLLVLRYRYFSRDFLTTVQTDDIYRHVYSPIFGEVNTSSVGGPNTNTTSTVANNVTQINPLTPGHDVVSSLVSLLNSIDAVPFLSDSLYSYSVTQSSSNGAQGFISDLQTMRRAGMLEKWLARNYFFPDTYVGQLRARYGVVPEDVNVLISQYLGGTESFVEGNQTVAPVDTPQMAAGSRTVVSGVNGKDSFSYQASDHCYIISFVSLMPLVNYDIKNMHTKELRVLDVPSPEFAQDSRVAIRTKDMLRGFDYQNDVLGYVPRYYHFRVHGDETHGRYLSDLRTYAWFRDWFNMTFTENIWESLSGHGFALTPYALRVHLSPDAFNNLAIWDDIAYGSCDIEFFANRPLPAAVDII